MKFSRCVFSSIPWLLLLTGCAVLRVEVDVYKGPLANHDEVQIHQMVSMATGSKKLLFELRNRLEQSERDAINTRNEGKTVNKPPPIPQLSENERYEHISKPEEFRSKQALLVNEILGLYYDRGRYPLLGMRYRELKQLVTKIDESKKAYLKKHDFTYRKEADERLKNAYEVFLNPSGEDVWHKPELILDMCLQAGDNTVGFSNEKRNKKQQEMLNTLNNLGDVPMDAHNVDFSMSFVNQLKTINKDKQVSCEPELGANEKFQLLLTTRPYEQHADELFERKETQKKKEFKQAVESIAQAYLDGREYTYQSAIGSLNLFIDLNSKGIESRNLSLLNSELIKFYNSLMVNLTPCGLRAPGNLDIASAGNLLKAHDEFRLHRTCRGENNGNKNTKFDRYNYRQFSRTKSLVSYSNVEGLDLKSIEKAVKNLGLHKSVLSTHLASGRLNIGLDEMMDRFVNHPAKEKEKREEQLKELESALVRFAEKVLLFANNYNRLRVVEEGGLEDLSQKKLLNNAMYASILQTVANTMLAHADERHHKRAFEERVGNHSRELALWTAAGKHNVYEVLNDLHAYFNTLITEIQNQIDQYKNVDEKISELNEKIKEVSMLAATESYKELLEEVRLLITDLDKADTETPEKKSIQQMQKKLQEIVAKLDSSERLPVPASVKADVDQLKKNLAELKLKKDSGQEKIKALEGQLEYAKNARDAFNDNRGKLIDANCDKETTNVYDKCLDVLIAEVKRDANYIETQKDIIPVFAKFPRPKPVSIPDGVYKSAKEVYITYIRALEIKHTNATLSGQTELAADIKKAIDQARYYLSGMIYLRPTMAYLRSANTGSSMFQPETYGSQSNLLTSSSSSDTVGGRSLNYIMAEVDHQFWQNINKIKVTGTGQSNRVLAKDDIGNWYLKSYSNNMEDVFNAARNLAMFSAGGVLGTGNGDKVDRDTAKTLQSQAMNTEDTVLDRIKRRYLEKTIANNQLLASKNSGIGIKINEAIKARKVKYDYRGGKFVEPVDLDEGKEEETINESFNRFLLNATRISELKQKMALKVDSEDFEIRKIGDQEVDGDVEKADAEKAALIKVIEAVINNELEPVIDQQMSAARTYEDNLSFLDGADD